MEYKNIRNNAGKKSHSIIGGIHASMMPEDVINDFDQVFVGEPKTILLIYCRADFPTRLFLGRP